MSPVAESSDDRFTTEVAEDHGGGIKSQSLGGRLRQFLDFDILEVHQHLVAGVHLEGEVAGGWTGSFFSSAAFTPLTFTTTSPPLAVMSISFHSSSL